MSLNNLTSIFVTGQICNMFEKSAHATGMIKNRKCVNNNSTHNRKSKIMVFSRDKIRNKPVIRFGDVLEVVYDYVYLGVKLNYNGSFNKAI